MVSRAFLNDIKIINSIYDTFYGKYPDYSKENKHQLTIEMQAMFYILSKYSYLGINYQFAYNSLIDYKMPISIDLQDLLVNAMMNLNDIDLKKEAFQIKDQVKNQIKDIGLIVRNYTNNFDHELMRLLVSILYTKEYIYPSSKEKKIAEFNSCSITDVENALKFCKEFNQEKTKKKVKKNKNHKTH